MILPRWLHIFKLKGGANLRVKWQCHFLISKAPGALIRKNTVTIFIPQWATSDIDPIWPSLSHSAPHLMLAQSDHLYRTVHYLKYWPDIFITQCFVSNISPTLPSLSHSALPLIFPLMFPCQWCKNLILLFWNLHFKRKNTLILTSKKMKYFFHSRSGAFSRVKAISKTLRALDRETIVTIFILPPQV